MFELATGEKRKNHYFEQPKILVFGSNIDTTLKARVVQDQLLNLSGVIDISIDLENWERVLRVECSSQTLPEIVLVKVLSMGFRCYEL